MRFANLFIALTFCLLLVAATGCTSVAFINKLDDLRPNDALVFGKIRVLRDGKDVTQCNLISNQAGKSGWGTAMQFLGSGDGVICARLPAGDNYLFKIIYRGGIGIFTAEYRYTFDPTLATLHLPQAGGVYYIGDITIDWTPPKSKSGKSEAFLTGALYGGVVGGFISLGTMPCEGGEAVIVVQDNLAENQKLFQERFHTDKKLVPVFLQLKNATNVPQTPSH
jgi:hypothetical protein